MDSLYEDLFWYLDHDEDGALDFFEFQEGLQDLGVSRSLEDDEVGFMKLRLIWGQDLWRGLLKQNGVIV